VILLDTSVVSAVLRRRRRGEAEESVARKVGALLAGGQLASRRAQFLFQSIALAHVPSGPVDARKAPLGIGLHAADCFVFLTVEGVDRLSAGESQADGPDGEYRDLLHGLPKMVEDAPDDLVHEVFAPTREEIRWAESVQEAWTKGDGASRGVVAMDGEMIEALHLTLAERILRRVKP
jgi:hypothetical protein